MREQESGAVIEVERGERVAGGLHRDAVEPPSAANAAPAQAARAVGGSADTGVARGGGEGCSASTSCPCYFSAAARAASSALGAARAGRIPSASSSAAKLAALANCTAPPGSRRA